jgi:polar amino acid transport system substrate-binding protein
MNILPRRHFGAALAGLLLIGSHAASAATSALKVEFYDSFAPFSFMDDQQQITGILPEMMKEILGHRMGLQVTVEGQPWARAQLMVQEGTADAFCTLATPAREAYASFTKQFVAQMQVALFYATDNPRKAEIEAIKTIEQIKGFRQGDYIGDSLADTNFKDFPIDFSPTIETVYRKIGAGRLDLTVTTDLTGDSVVKQLGMGDKIVRIPFHIGQATDFRIGIRKSLPDTDDLVAKADAAIAAATADGTLDRIIAKYTK